MPAIAANATQFLLSTDYQQDKVVYLKTDSFTAPGPMTGSYRTIAHGLPFTPLVGGSWSTSADFSVTYDFGTGTIPSADPLTAPFNLSLDVLADSTNIYIVPTNVSGSNKTVYVRLYALEPADTLATVSSTQAAADSFTLNSDYNYTKLWSADKITGVTASSTTVVTHNLGRVPQVSVWATSSARTISPSLIYFTNVTYPMDTANIVAVSANTVTFKTDSSSTITRFDYRIYHDETGVGL